MTEYEQNHVPKIYPTSWETPASERGPSDCTSVHPEDEMSVRRLAPDEITCLTSDVSISISTMGKTAKDGKCKLSLSNLLMEPETK